MMNHKPVFGVLAAGVAALLLAGCGGNATPPAADPTSPAATNPAAAGTGARRARPRPTTPPTSPSPSR